jgi:predicted 3-demethylubiquinone-9 3-methyltransferase (glyoxalase superfamily)
MMDSSFSLMVQCEDQAAIDYYWEGLLAGGGTPQACGWLKDAYGLSWQVTPPVLMKYLTAPDAERSARVMDVMLAMQKLDLAQLQQAWEG